MRGFEDKPIDWSPAMVWIDAHGNRQQTLEFIVPGIPQPKGSVIKGRWGGYHSANKDLADWEEAVCGQAKAAMAGRWRSAEVIIEGHPRHIHSVPYPLEPFEGPVLLGAIFVMPRPKTFTPPKWLEKDRPRWRSMFVNELPPHLKKPDVDKCLRAVCDAMTGPVWHDDSQVVVARPRKRYVYPDETPGAIVLVTSDVRVP